MSLKTFRAGKRSGAATKMEAARGAAQEKRWWALAFFPALLFFFTPLIAGADMAPSNSGGAGVFGEDVRGWANPGTGAAHASYPIKLFAARGLSQPQLQLNYASNSDVREAGMAWGLDLPIVERRPVQGGAPAYTLTDRMFYSGQPLVFIRTVTSPTSQMRDGTVEELPSWSIGWRYYRVHNDAHIRLFWGGENGSTWRVQAAGEVLEFGRPVMHPLSGDDVATVDVDATSPGGTGIHRWRLSRRYEAAYCGANSACGMVVYRWRQLGRYGYDMPVLTDLYDTPPASGPPTNLHLYAHHARIVYESDTQVSGDPAHNTVSYAPVWKQKYPRRIKRIDVAGNGHNMGQSRAVARRYHFIYETGLHRSFLKSISEEGACPSPVVEVSDGGGDYEAPESNCARLPPTTFEYTSYTGIPGTPQLKASPKSPPPDPEWRHLFQNQRAVSLLDIDRDGAMDLVQQPSPGATGTTRLYLTETNQVIGRLLYYPLSNADGNVLAIHGGLSLLNFGDLRNVASVYWRPNGTPTGDPPVHRMRLGLSGSDFTWVQTATGPLGPTRMSPTTIAVGDIDGNGALDILDYELKTAGSPPTNVLHTRIRTAPRYDDIPSANHADLNKVPAWGDPITTNLRDTPENPFRTFADLNGDGIQDLVTIKPPGYFIYYPGNGRGQFECDPTRTACFEPPACADDKVPNVGACGPRWVEFQFPSQTYETAFVGDSIRPNLFIDFNHDGFVDLLQPEMAQEPGSDPPLYHLTFSRWMNDDGVHFHKLDKIFTGYLDAHRVMIGDVNGNGTADIVFVSDSDNAYRAGPEAGYRDQFFFGYPGLLKTINSGLGATTTFSYKSLHELDEAARDTPTPWQTHSPVPMQLVTSVVHVQPGQEQRSSEYAYRDPAFDSFEQRVLGFRQVDVEGPTSTRTRTKYYFGHCQPVRDTCFESSDLDFERSISGVPYFVETSYRYDTSIVHSTTLTHYNTIGVYLEEEDQSHPPAFIPREVRFAYPDRVETYLYNTETPLPNEEHLQHRLADDSRVPAMDVVIRSTAVGSRHRLRQELERNIFGHVVRTRNHGEIHNNGSAIDPVIETRYDVKPHGSGDLYLFRTKSQVLSGNGTEPDRVRIFDYNDKGELTDVKGTLVGTLPLARSHEKGSEVAPAPASASVDHPSAEAPVQLAHFQYGGYGNLVRASGPPGTGCVATRYDTDYLHLPSSTSRNIDNCEFATLTTAWTYDGLFDLVSIVDREDFSRATVSYDEFGRVKSSTDSDPEIGTLPSKPSEFSYHFSPTGNIHGTSVKHWTSDAEQVTAWQYVDAFGQAVASIAQGDASTGDPTPWVVEGAATYWNRGVATRRPYPTSTEPSTLQFQFPDPSDGQAVTDPFGRVSETSDRGRRTQTKYHGLSVTTYDEKDLATGTVSTPSTVTYDGHGRVVSVVERGVTSTGFDLFYTRFDYNLAGQVVKIKKGHMLGSEQFVRWMKYDSLGRMVLNGEPNTSKNFVAGPNDPAATTTMRTWRYAYDDAGRLVGTSDARGCGKNLFYDGLGRLVAEDYSPCLAHHEGYTPIDWTKGTGAEVVYQYDEESAVLPNSPGRRGRLTSVADRGAITHFAYDARGRLRETARRITRPQSDGPSADLDFGGLDLELGIRIHIEIGGGGGSSRDRYGKHLFKKTLSYDLANRLVMEETGADVPELLGENDKSWVQYAYGKRGSVKGISSSYGPLVSEMRYNVDGTLAKVKYGDGAGTSVDFQYTDHDIRRFTVSRSPADLWTRETPNYTPAEGPAPTSLQTVLSDLEFAYDAVGNPLTITDHRNPDEWPAGAKPRSQTLAYDDFDRLISERVEHHPGVDSQVSPFASEEENRDPTVVPRLARAKRSTGFDVSYDWNGNTKSIVDNDSTVFDRGALGTITNGDLAGHPNQLTASSLGVQVRYDDTGNVVEMLVPRSGECTAFWSGCSHHFVYDWDEVGQLVRARRWDYDTIPADEPRYPEVPFGSPMVDAHYAYSQGQRVLRSVNGSLSFERHSAEIFSSLRLDNAGWEFDDYEITAATESAYLAGIGHVMVTPEELPAMSSSRQHVFLAIGDRLGSTNVVIDRDTGEMAESVQYHPYGTVDSDYRPERWGSHREPYQFTGKESDIELGLTYFGARYYSPALSRWMSADPLTIHAARSDLNPYAYVHGSPLNRVDPIGLCDEGYSWCPRGGMTSSYGDYTGGGYGSYDPSGFSGGGGDPAGYMPGPGGESLGRSGLIPRGGGGPGYARHGAQATAGAGVPLYQVLNSPSMFQSAWANGNPVGVGQDFSAGVGRHSAVIAGTGLLAAAQAGILTGAALLEAGGIGLQSVVQSIPWQGVGRIGQVGTDLLSALNGNPVASAIGGGGIVGLAGLLDDVRGAGRLPLGLAEDFVAKVVNSNMPHATERAVERAGFATVQDARMALQAFGREIERSGALPAGAIADTAHADRVIVPGFGIGGAVVYQVRNSVLKLKTVLEWRP